MFIYQLLSLFAKLVGVYSFILVAYALMSWFPGAYQTKVGQLVIKLSQPYLKLFDRFNLSIGPIDFTIIVAIFLLNIVSDGLIRLIQRIFWGI